MTTTKRTALILLCILILAAVLCCGFPTAGHNGLDTSTGYSDIDLRQQATVTQHHTNQGNASATSVP